MTITSHTAASCLLTVWIVESGMGLGLKLLILTLGSFVLHLLMDLIPHGFIATPWTIFKKWIPTLAELVPGPLILFGAIAFFGNATWFLLAVFFGLLPDLAAVWVHKHGYAGARIPGCALVQKLHRKVHWFEEDHPNGEVTYLFPNHPLLLVEMVGAAVMVVILFSLAGSG